MKPTLYMMLGYPGAGKTTTAEVIADLTGAVHLSSDKVRMELFPDPTFSEAEHSQLYEELDKRTTELLSSGRDVIYDANLNRHIHRQEKYDICEQVDAKPVLIWVQTAREVAKQRATDGSRQHLIPNQESAGDMFDRIAELIETPQPQEHATLIDGTKVTASYISSCLGL